MVHGYNGSCDYFYPYALPGLAAERHVIAFDFPGSGWSGAWPSYTLEAYARFVPSFIDALGIEQADLLGHSMGGLVVMSTAAANPHRFRKLVLVDSAGARPLKLGLPQSVRMLSDPSLWLFKMYPTFARVALKGRASREGLSILRATGMEPAVLSRFALPTLIIWGERDRLVPPEHGTYLARHIPNAQHVIIKGSGHMPFYERPQGFSRHVLAFLR
jgi:pimeloyl-ACP methyl ester carboxylesterase